MVSLDLCSTYLLGPASFSTKPTPESVAQRPPLFIPKHATTYAPPRSTTIVFVPVPPPAPPHRNCTRTRKRKRRRTSPSSPPRPPSPRRRPHRVTAAPTSTPPPLSSPNVAVHTLCPPLHPMATRPCPQRAQLAVRPATTRLGVLRHRTPCTASPCTDAQAVLHSRHVHAPTSNVRLAHVHNAQGRVPAGAHGAWKQGKGTVLTSVVGGAGEQAREATGSSARQAASGGRAVPNHSRHSASLQRRGRRKRLAQRCARSRHPRLYAHVDSNVCSARSRARLDVFTNFLF
ncbi:hypothetical protein R3P38DRAFT_2775175 [Favolaschia claudopus]|uniref:Uncharacterized protein n=1 Tax=Favolaschia claudopus TaxID=2862362 RepID=A0AAW0BU16_9AGAR